MAFSWFDVSACFFKALLFGFLKVRRQGLQRHFELSSGSTISHFLKSGSSSQLRLNAIWYHFCFFLGGESGPDLEEDADALADEDSIVWEKECVLRK